TYARPPTRQGPAPGRPPPTKLHGRAVLRHHPVDPQQQDRTEDRSDEARRADLPAGQQEAQDESADERSEDTDDDRYDDAAGVTAGHDELGDGTDDETDDDHPDEFHGSLPGENGHAGSVRPAATDAMTVPADDEEATAGVRHPPPTGTSWSSPGARASGT